MKKNFPSLNALRVFETVSRTKSLKRAAAILGVTQSAVSRQLTTLEEQVGVKLIHRDNKVHALTPSGEALAPELSRIFRQLERIVTHAMREGEQSERQITVGISHELYTHWLAPLLPEFQQLFPHITLAFAQVPEYMDRQNEEFFAQKLLHNEVDVILAFGQSSLKSLICTTIQNGQFNLVQHNHAATDDTESDTDNELVHISHQTLPTGLYRSTGVTTGKQNVAQTTQMAQAIAAQQNQCVLVPHVYQLQNNQECTQIPMEQPLAAIIRKEDEREFSMVAVMQWLEHRGRKVK
ncbi:MULTISPECIES: LysR family transcriptional regulator [Gammaproteobacteria]|uniref:LysR family transcriptional regulator n=1 Tax=Gammaproteobacteria TaxID=1236 RepID=UPI000DD01B31|nr:MULTISPECIES: LysR family transcriptional regulator [Gammaproteobacteria]RTE87194.1 LysR family transcriptional regulator [Aliidiomarina sp. B3213]TCZ93018.1 LysR family transcriptional regulator [Lysobacter sp. N42]